MTSGQPSWSAWVHVGTVRRLTVLWTNCEQLKIWINDWGPYSVLLSDTYT